MKKYISIFAVVAAASLTSCSDFLNVESEGFVSTTNAANSDQNCVDLVDGLYFKLAGDGDNMYGRTLMYEQAGANDIVWGRNRSWPDLALNKINGNISPLKEIFGDVYELIARSNAAVDKLVQVSNPSAIQTRSLGEAYFMRAFAHFLAAYRYGTGTQGVPFVRYEDFDGLYDYSIPTQQPTVMDNYAMIVSDLEKAEQLLPKFEEYGPDDQGRAHKAAALGYMAKTYAYWACWDNSKWDKVVECVNKLESEYGRGLVANFDDLFSSDFDKFWNNEYIWSIPGDGATNKGTEMVGVMLENKGWGKYNGWGYFKPTLDIYNEFLKDGDREHNPRLKRSILAYGDEFTFWGETMRYCSGADVEAGFAIYKYMDPYKYSDPVGMGYANSNGDWPTARINFPLLRFADCLLLRAEAYLMTGKAADATKDINRLRTRAGVATLAGTATTADLYHERRVELAFEMSDHLYDLKRWAHAGDATLKELALAELSNDPQVRHYDDRKDPDSPFTVGAYENYNGKAKYQDYMIAFPYSDEVIAESNGALKQNPGYVK